MKRKDGESLLDYKVRLFQNRKEYGLDWKDIADILHDDVNPHTVRKGARGYLQAYNDICNDVKFDKSILMINDVHLPFERSDVLEVIKKHSKQITHLFFGGDLLDCYSISKFPHGNHLSIKDELIYGHKWLKEVRKILGNDIPIYLIKGNHCARWTKEILKDETLQNFINPEILQMYEDGFQLFIDGKKHEFEPIHNLHYIPKWYANIDNKIIYCHPLDFSSVDGKITEKVAEHFLNKGEEFEICVNAHTHKYCQQTISRRQGVFVVENGCMCKPMGYADTGKLGYTPQHYCYTIVKYNDDEKINFNNIKVHHLNEEDIEESNSLVKLS